MGEDLEKSSDTRDLAVKTLREKCGLEQFLEFEKLAECVNYVSTIWFQFEKEVDSPLLEIIFSLVMFFEQKSCKIVQFLLYC